VQVISKAPSIYAFVFFEQPAILLGKPSPRPSLVGKTSQGCANSCVLSQLLDSAMPQIAELNPSISLE
jgi:hypothetical protein